MSILMIMGIILGLLILLLIMAWLFGVFKSKGYQIIKPSGEIKGRALIVFDPGFTGGTKTAATYMAQDLNSKGYQVKLAGVRSSEALDTAGYDLLIVGSPTYGAKPTGSVEDYLRDLKPNEDIISAVYSLAGSDDQDSNKIMAQILEDKNIKVKLSTKFGNTALGVGDKNKYSQYVLQLLD